MLAHYDPLSQKARERAIERAFQAKGGPKEFAGMASYAKRRKRQRELALWLWDQEFDFLLTINSNDPFLSYAGGRVALRKLGGLIDRYFLGKHWCKHESSKRTFFVAVPESRGGELHYHVLLRIPGRANKRNVCKLRAHLTQRLVQHKRIFRRGDVDVQRITGINEVMDSGRQFKTACYVVKDLWDPEASEQWVISTEFHTGQSSKRI